MRVRLAVICLITVMMAVIAFLPWWLVVHNSPPNPGVAATTTDAGLTIDQIRPLSSLTTLKVQVADVIESELHGKTGKVRAVLIVKGEFALGVELKLAKFELVDPEKRHAVLHLPQPSVQYIRLDHQRTRVLGIWSSGLWLIVPGGGDADAVTVNHGYRDAEGIIGSAANDQALIQRCCVQTEEVLRSFLRALGWSLEVQWR